MEPWEQDGPEVVKRFMYVNRKAPYGTIYALENLEVVLIAAAFDQDVSVVFLDDGVYQLKKSQDTAAIGMCLLAENGDFNGTALVATQVVKKKPKVKVAVKGTKAAIAVSAKKVKAKKFKGSVVVRKIVREDEYGAPVYKKIGKARLRNGKAALRLKKLAKGKNTLVFQITLKGGKYGNAEVTRTVKLKR